jgi:hypothetical protein
MDGLVTASDTCSPYFYTRAHVEKYMEVVSPPVTNGILRPQRIMFRGQMYEKGRA